MSTYVKKRARRAKRQGVGDWLDTAKGVFETAVDAAQTGQNAYERFSADDDQGGATTTAIVPTGSLMKDVAGGKQEYSDAPTSDTPSSEDSSSDTMYWVLGGLAVLVAGGLVYWNMKR